LEMFAFLPAFMLVFHVSGTVLFTETFDYNVLPTEWIISETNTGVWGLGSAPWLENNSNGLMTATNNSLFGISRKLPEFSMLRSALIFQFLLTIPQMIECGGSTYKNHSQ
jgi:hypothetical protein